MTQLIAIIDGTLSRLEAGVETHAGKVFKLSLRLPPHTRRVFYDPGVQGRGVKKWAHVALGTGLNHSVVKIYQKLSAHYQDGDEIYLFGYSRGAYGIRLVAGMISKFGLLRPEYSSIEYAEHALELYAQRANPATLRSFRNANCQHPIDVSFLGVWDTVKALGLPLPILRRYTPFTVHFKDLRVPKNIKLARHALAYHEDRIMFEPELWQSAAPQTKMEQMLFAGDHAVVGGDLEKGEASQKLGHFSLHWILEAAELAGLQYNTDWRARFALDRDAPAQSERQNWYDRYWWRRPRRFHPPEYFVRHPSLLERTNDARNCT